MITGGCLCGRVRYEAQGELHAVLCYCRECQRASGTSRVPVMVVDKTRFRVTGTPNTFATQGDSGRPSVRHFCPHCGSLLFGMPEAAPQFVTIYVGSLDDPSGFTPTIAQYTRNRPRWEKSVDGAVEYEGSMPF